MTMPKASKQRVAVRSRLYLTGWAPGRLRVRGPTLLSESAVISLTARARQARTGCGGPANQMAGGPAPPPRPRHPLKAPALRGAAQDGPHAAVERAQGGGGRPNIGRLRVVDVEHAAELGDALEPMRDAGEGA